MRIVVVADPSWLPDLEAQLLDDDIRRITPGDELPGADVLVATQEHAAALLDRLDPLTTPVLWVVGRSTPRSELFDMVRAAPAAELLFEPVRAAALVQSIRELADEAGEAGVGGRGRREEPAPEPARDEELATSMARLWDRFQATMLERLALLESVGADLLEGEAGERELAEAERAAHKLHGSLGTFGLSRGSELAAELEALVEAGPPDAGDVYRFSELVVELRSVIEEGAPAVRAAEDEVEGAAAPEGRERAATRVRSQPQVTALLVEPDPDRAERLAEVAVARGWRPVTMSEPEEARERVRALRGPLVAVVDPDAGAPGETDALLERLSGLIDPPPVLFWARARSQEERVRAAGMGVAAFLDKSSPPEAVLDRAGGLLAAEEPEESTVLVVDDDPSVLRALTFILRAEGFQVRTLDDPLDFWRTLERVEPDLLLLDVDLPGVSGYQLCRAVRADPRWGTLPVLFMTAQSEPRAVIAGFEAGGDDYIVKPVVGPELTARVEGRLERLRAEERESWRDRSTGLAGRRAALERLELQVALAARHEDVVTVALLELREADEGQAEERLLAAAERLRDAVRAEDVLARVAPRELLVARYGEAGAAVRRWLERTLSERERDGLWLGTASFPELETVEALVEAARSGRSRARRTGTEGVEAGGAGADAEADIVVVEDDETVAELLLQTLEDRGYRTRWIRDGVEAADRLGGEAPSLQPALIILDVGLPGLDGLTLLRRLRRDGVTRRTNVLMLTARSAESEVVRALELGAYDHVPKPFSVSELLHRVRRAVEDKRGA